MKVRNLDNISKATSFENKVTQFVYFGQEGQSDHIPLHAQGNNHIAMNKQ